MDTRSYAGDLPQEVLSVLPQDSYAQMQLAHRISNHALNQRASQLEQESHNLRQNLSQKSSQVSMLEQRVMQLESDFSEVQSKHKMAVEATQKLNGEKNALINTVKKLNRDVARLEGFKRNLLNTLRDDDDMPGNVAAVQQAAKPFSDSSLASLDLSSDRLISSVLASVNPVPSSGGGSPSFSAADAPTMSYTPHANGGANFGTTSMNLGSPRLESKGSPQRLNTSQSLASSPRIDGKEFFRQARARLSYEQFSQFLQNIKELNAGRQSREDTLGKAREIFGSDNSDLYVSFEGLLSRHLPAM